jgi:hypothetical protein
LVFLDPTIFVKLRHLVHTKAVAVASRRVIERPCADLAIRKHLAIIIIISNEAVTAVGGATIAAAGNSVFISKEASMFECGSMFADKGGGMPTSRKRG